MLNYSVLPHNLQDGMKLYIEHGIKPGSFLTYCLESDFVGLMGQASTQTWDYIFTVAMFFYHEMPGRFHANCPWGSKEAVKQHMERMQSARAAQNEAG